MWDEMFDTAAKVKANSNYCSGIATEPRERGRLDILQGEGAEWCRVSVCQSSVEGRLVETDFTANSRPGHLSIPPAAHTEKLWRHFLHCCHLMAACGNTHACECVPHSLSQSWEFNYNTMSWGHPLSLSWAFILNSLAPNLHVFFLGAR